MDDTSQSSNRLNEIIFLPGDYEHTANVSLTGGDYRQDPKHCETPYEESRIRIQSHQVEIFVLLH